MLGRDSVAGKELREMETGKEIICVCSVCHRVKWNLRAQLLVKVAYI